MVYHLVKEQTVRRPLKEVFAFFERPENLAKITPPELGFEIVTPSPIAMNVGTLIDYNVRAIGIKLHWKTLITAYDPPYSFVDEQLKGPYIYWHHTHGFEEIPGGTLLRDHVRYIVPFGVFGKAAHAFKIKHDLERIFEYRSNYIANHFS